jgi:hypothetical protein
MRLIIKAMAVTSGAAAVALALIACGDPKYQPPAIVVTFSPYFSPPTSLNTGSTTGIAAVVMNDAKNAGVNFTCVPAGDCGSFNPAHIASSVPTCYQAPGAVPSGSAVTLTATSVSDPAKSISSSPITISRGDPVSGCTP